MFTIGFLWLLWLRCDGSIYSPSVDLLLPIYKTCVATMTWFEAVVPLIIVCGAIGAMGSLQGVVHRGFEGRVSDLHCDNRCIINYGVISCRSNGRKFDSFAMCVGALYAYRTNEFNRITSRTLWKSATNVLKRKKRLLRRLQRATSSVCVCLFKLHACLTFWLFI